VFPSFALNSEGDDAWLFSSDATSTLTGYVQGSDFGATANGVSLGRYTNSVSKVDYPAQIQATLGRTNAGPRVGPIVLSEILYHPAAAASNTPASYIELANLAATNTPLYDPAEPTNTWRIRNAVDFDFPTNTIMPPASRLLLVGFDPLTNTAALASFRALFAVDAGVRFVGPWAGKLGNGDETLELKKPDSSGTNGVPYVMVEKVHYLDHAPWPAGADGTGLSLQRRWLLSYANEPTNWFASAPTAGAPNLPNQLPSVQISSPATGTAYRTPTNLLLVASAADTDGWVQSVEFRANGQPLADVAEEPFSFLWTNPPPGTHTLTAVALDNLSAATVSAPVGLTLIPPAPVISLTQPADGSVLLMGFVLPITADVLDLEGFIDRVEFFADGQLLAQVLAPPFTTTWSPGTAGTFALTAVAVDNWGSAATSAVITVAFTSGTNILTTLLPAGSTWNYLDNGSDLGTNWIHMDFADATWQTGPAELGYGDTVESRPEATAINYGPDANQKHITYYFRQAFTTTQPASVQDLTVNLLRDDGGIVYLNGAEIFRSNMPEGPVNYLTLATNAVAGAEETLYFQKAVAPALLREGTNVLAVEIHQSNPSSSDVSFDLSLTGTRTLLAPAILAQPSDAAVPGGATVTFSVGAGGTPPLSYQWELNGARLPGATASTFVVSNVAMGNLGDYQVFITNSLGWAASAPAMLSLLDAPAPGLLTITPVGSRFCLLYHGAPGMVCEFSRSLDLLHWDILGEISIPPHGLVEYLEADPPNAGAYYRARQK